MKEVTKLGLTGGGEEIKDGSMMEMLVHRLGVEMGGPELTVYR